MKKLLFSALSIAAIAVGSLQAQVAKTPFVEHFSQASCNPCVLQDADIYAELATFGSANYIKLTYQTSWPGVDPMNADYANGPQSRLSYYGVDGVPGAILSGDPIFIFGPSVAITAATLAAKAIETTNYSMVVTHSWAANSDLIVNVAVTNVTANPISVADRLYVSMIEDQITFAVAPGSN
jgi:hypothetical protein